MADASKYKVIIKVAELTGLAKGVASVKVRGTCDKKPRDTAKAPTSNCCAQWEADNTLAKNSLKARDKEIAEIVILDGSNDVPLGSCELDLIDFLNKVPVGSKPKKFKVDKKIKGGEAVLKLSVSISREGGDKDDDDDDERPREKSSKKSPDLKTGDASKRSRPDKDKKRTVNNGDDSDDASKPENGDSKIVVLPASPLSRGKAGGSGPSIVNPRSATYTTTQLRGSTAEEHSNGNRSRANSDASDKSLPPADMTPRTAIRLAKDSPSNSPRDPDKSGRPVNRLVQPSGVSPFSSPQRPAKFNTLATSAPSNHKSDSPEQVHGLAPNSGGALKRPMTPGVLRPASAAGGSQASKYPSLGGKSRDRAHRRGASNEVSIDQIGDLKQRYAVERQEADEKFLIDTLIGSEANHEKFVAAYIIYQSLLNWNSFDVNTGALSRVLSAIENCIHASEDSRSVLFSWLSNTLAMRYMAHEDRKRNASEDMEQIFAQFEEDLKKLDPLLKKAFKDALLAPAGSERVLQDAKTGTLATIFGILSDFVKLVQEHSVYEGIQNHFYKRIFHYVTSALIEALIDGGNSCSQGFQLKMVVTQFEEWASKKVNPAFGKIAEKALEPAREAADTICYPSKKDLLQPATRSEICPLLRPALLAQMLAGYKADIYLAEPVPPKVVEDLQKLDHNFMASDQTFEPQEQIPLPFEIDLLPLDFTKIQLPKLILDRPGFAFLKQGALAFKAAGAPGGGDDEKW